MQSLLDVMERDIRRAGYFANASLNLSRDANGNPVIAPTDRTAMFSLMASAGSSTTTWQDMQRISVVAPLYDCILLRYDANDDGSIAGTNEIMGYRFKSTELGLEFKQWDTVADQLDQLCEGDEGWNNISQDGQVQLSSVTFAITPAVGFSVPTGQRTITVSMVGQSQQKPTLSLTLQRQVRMRNDQY
jgi:type II secretory pathway component PulJ